MFVSEKELGMEELQKAIEKIEGKSGVDSVTVQGNPLSEDGKSAKFSLTLAGNPYAVEAFEVVDELRNDSAGNYDSGRCGRYKNAYCG